MANPSQTAVFVKELSSASLYKRTQGRLVRELTLLAIVVVTIGACYALATTWMIDFNKSVSYGVSTAIAVVVCWAAFRMVNFPPFAEFLISVQAEVQKVNWPSWTELKRATIVVICTMFFLGFVLFVYDVVWMQLLTALGVLKVTAG